MNRMMKNVIILAAVLTIATGASAQSWGDYTFYSQQNSTKAYLLNSSGSTYHSWTFASSRPTGYSAYLLEGGSVLRTVAHQGNSFNGGGMTGEIEKTDYSGTVLWDYVYSTTQYCAHHDICPMPNGNVLIIAYESKTASEATQAGCSQSIVMWPDKIVEVQPSGTSGGTVVWEWHVWDHLCQNYNAAKNNYVTSIVQHPELININYNTQKDWMHCNGLDYNPTLDQITFSSHMFNEVYVIDHSTTTAQAASHAGGNSGKGGDILYRWGNPAAYQASGTTNFNVVHDAHWVPEGCPRANYLVAFNNKGGAGNKSCVDFFYPPYNGYTYNITLGSAFTPSTYAYRYLYSGQASQDMGNSQQLPNGNSLITISQSGYMYEIDTNMNVVWSKTVTGTVVNARRYTACYVTGAVAVTAAASPSSGCPGNSVQLSATPASGSSFTYSWTSNPAGFTSTLQNPVVTPVVTTSYFVSMTSGTCTSYDTVTYTITSQPTVAVTANPQQVCPGAAVQLNATPSTTGTYTFSWTSVPAGFTSTIQNPVAYPSVATVYNVEVTSGSCIATNSLNVGMLAPPTVVATASPGEICPNATSQLLATPAGTTGYTYNWSSIPAGFSSSIPNPTVAPSATTQYIVSIYADGCSAADSVTVTVDALPATPVITRSGDSLMSSSATGNQWFLNGDLIAGATGQYYVITQMGSYQVQVTGTTGCISVLSDPFVIVGLNDLPVSENLVVYPNPTSGAVNLRPEALQWRSFRVWIRTACGEVIRTAENSFTFDLSDRPGGVYFLTVLTDRSESVSKKIIVIR